MVVATSTLSVRMMNPDRGVRLAAHGGTRFRMKASSGSSPEVETGVVDDQLGADPPANAFECPNPTR